MTSTIKILIANEPDSDEFRAALKNASGPVLRASANYFSSNNNRLKHCAVMAHINGIEQENDMPPKKQTPNEATGRTAHADASEASKEIYALAQADAETKLTAMREEVDAVRVESQAMGVLQTLQATSAYGELLKAITLHRIKENKEYKKGGMTWVEFCESQGLECRTVDRMLSDLTPIMDAFSDSVVRFSGMPFSKIRMLGRQISGQLSEIKNNCLVYGDESIPLTPEYRDDLQALIERIGEDAKEKIDTLEATVSAKDKVLKSKGDVINKMERALKKYEKEAEIMGITPEEDAYIQQINNLKTGFDGYLLRLEKNIVPEDYETFTPRMKAALISAAHYMQMQILALYDTVTTEHGNATMCPEALEDFEKWTAAQQG